MSCDYDLPLRLAGYGVLTGLVLSILLLAFMLFTIVCEWLQRK